MKGLRLAAGMFLAYGVLVLGNAILYYSWSGDAGDLPRVIIRLAGVGLLTYGLWNAERWAWWLTLLMSLFWGITGIAALGLMAAADFLVLEGRPYPTLDIIVLITQMALLVGTAVALLLPKNKAALKKAVVQI